MGSFANSIFTVLLGWFQSVVYSIWNAFSAGKNGSFLTWIGRNWKILAVFLCAAGAVLDFAVYMVRWKPFKVWSSFLKNKKTGSRKDRFNESPVFESAAQDPPPYTEDRFSETPVTAQPEAEKPAFNDDYRIEPGRSAGTEEIEQRIVRSGRRRRGSRMMSDEERTDLFPPVDEMIDSNEAYYRPVYPKTWRKQENENDQ